MRHIDLMFLIINVCLVAFICIFMNACSDLNRSNVLFVASANALPKEQEMIKKLDIQAMRKAQIIEDNHTRVLMIAHYMNEIDKSFIKQDKGEVFLVELYARDVHIDLDSLDFTLISTYHTLKAQHISKQNIEELGIFAPDVSYNDVYKVVFDSIGFRGRDNLKLIAEIVDIGMMQFDFSYAKSKSKLAK